MLELSVIPNGKYCYDFIDGERKVCPYWRRFKNGAVCELVKLVSIDCDIDNFIWDQVKECGINNKTEPSEDEA